MLSSRRLLEPIQVPKPRNFPSADGGKAYCSPVSPIQRGSFWESGESRRFLR